MPCRTGCHPARVTACSCTICSGVIQTGSAAQMMDVKTLTRENVASHLQKYRLQLRRAGGYDQQARNTCARTHHGAVILTCPGTDFELSTLL